MRTLATIVAASLLSGALHAQGTFPLTYQDAEGSLQVVTQRASRGFGVTPSKPPGVTGVPDGAACCSMDVGGRSVWAAVVGGDSPKLYVDTDGDNDLADEKPLAGKAQGPQVAFGTVELATPAGTPVRVALQAYMDRGKPAKPRFLMLRGAGCLTGKVTLAGKTYNVAVIDSNLNGRYSDTFKGDAMLFQNMDALAIDLNGDGRFAPPSLTIQPMEWMPLAKGLKVADAYYTVVVAADGSTIELAKADPGFGTLDLGASDVEIMGFSDFGFQSIQGGGKVRLPAGKYMPIMVSLSRTDTDGAKWTLMRSGGPDTLSQLQIKAGETCAMKLGPPLVAKTDAKQSGKNVMIGFSLVGKAGEQYAPGAEKGGKRLPPPTFEIIDETEKVIHTGKFEYG